MCLPLGLPASAWAQVHDADSLFNGGKYYHKVLIAMLDLKALSRFCLATRPRAHACVERGSCGEFVVQSGRFLPVLHCVRETGMLERDAEDNSRDETAAQSSGPSSMSICTLTKNMA